MMGLDRWIIERIAEPCVWWLERTLGLAHGIAMRATLTVWIAGLIWRAWDGDAVWVAIATMTVLSWPLLLWHVSSVERDAARGFNLEKHSTSHACFRLFFLGCTAPMWGLIVARQAVTPLDLAHASYLIHLYVRACDRPPPMAEYGRDLVPEAQ